MSSFLEKISSRCKLARVALSDNTSVSLIFSAEHRRRRKGK